MVCNYIFNSNHFVQFVNFIIRSYRLKFSLVKIVGSYFFFKKGVPLKGNVSLSFNRDSDIASYNNYCN